MIKINLMVHHNINLNQFNNKTPEIRDLLQLEGTEKGRNIHGEDIWIRYIKAWSELHMSRGIKYIIISDVRFKNEYEFIKKNGGLIFRMFAPNRNEKRLRKESIDEKMYEKIKNHQSETDLDDVEFDIVVNNIDKIDIKLEFA
jgi:IS5 family transposase